MNPFSRYPVAVQIAAGFFVGIALLGLVASAGIRQIGIARARANEAATLGAIATLTRDVMVQELELRRLPADNGAAAALRNDLDTLAHSDQTNAVDSARLEQVDLEEAAIESDVTALSKQPSTESAFERLSTDDDVLLTYASAQAKNASAEFERALAQVVAVLLGSTAAAVAALAITAFLIGGNLARRLGHVSSALQDVTQHDVTDLTDAFGRLSNGDLSAAFEAKRALIADSGRDEIAGLAESYNGVTAGLGLVASAFNHMTRTLRRMISGIADATEGLAAISSRMSVAASESTVAVGQIAASIAGVADGARDQAERISSATAQIAELSHAAGRIAAASEAQAVSSADSVATVGRLEEQIVALAALGTTLERAASDARGRALSGQASVEQTAAAMSRIKATTAFAHAAMGTLETRSRAVSEIVAAIEEIAERTNLLALNAAIEAARAGEQGRGFAVVAGEVRKLAEQSRTATGKVGGILEAIRDESVRAAGAITTAWEQMDAGSALSVEATEALNVVGAAIAQTAEIANEVAERSSEMQAASGELSRSIASISRAIDENALTAAAVSASSDRILQTIRPVTELADAQATTAREVSDATVALSGEILEIDASSRDARVQAELLRELVGAFQGVRASTVLTSAARRAFSASRPRASATPRLT